MQHTSSPWRAHRNSLHFFLQRELFDEDEGFEVGQLRSGRSVAAPVQPYFAEDVRRMLDRRSSLER